MASSSRQTWQGCPEVRSVSGFAVWHPDRETDKVPVWLIMVRPFPWKNIEGISRPRGR